MRIICIYILLTIAFGCDSGGRQSEFKDSFDNCVLVTDKTDLKPHRLVDLKFYVPDTWKVRDDKRGNNVTGIVCMDFPLAKKEKKIRTFTVYEFDNQKTDLKDYFESQLKLMRERDMIVLETGRKRIDHNPSYYVVTRDTVQSNPINQLFLFSDYSSKRYTIQIAMTATDNPTDELCKLIWLVDKIELTGN
jgi:hypothetical protein